MGRIIFVFAILTCIGIQCRKRDESIKTPVPIAPTNLSGKAVSSSSVSLSWSDNSTNETGFKMERKTRTETYKAINTTGINIETYNDTGLISNTTYKYRVYAFNAAGGSITYSNEVAVTTDSLKHTPAVTTTPISSITLNAAISGGNVSSDGGSVIISRGVVWSTSQNPTISLCTKTLDTSSSATFNSIIGGLANNTTYYVKAYATNNIGTGYGEEISFKTTDISLAIFSDSLIRVTLITEKSSSVYVPSLISDGGSSITGKGVVWSTSGNPDITLSTKTSNGTGTARFSGNMTGLAANTTYYVRAYATNSAGTGYSKEVNFKTLNYALPSVSDSIDVSEITNNSGRVWIWPLKSDGGTALISRGVVWSTTQNPTISLSTKTSSTSTEILNFNITGLDSNQTYYVREYATNSVGTSYGKVISFVTSAVTIPTITTKIIDTIYRTAALGGGSISDNGGSPVLKRGVCWNTVPNPTIALITKTSDGSGNGIFRSNIIGLTANTTYYVRAYATNSVGTAYGNEISITTEPISKPSIYTFVVNGVHSSGITSNPINYTSGGEFYDDGGATIYQKGVCWGTNQNPTVSLNTRTSDGSGTASFTSSITGLNPNMTYYIRSYATNGAGTAYGNQVTFTTSIPPIGQSFQGGVIAYIFEPGDSGYITGETHGLIAASTDQSQPAPWCPNYSYIYTGASGTALGTGKTNTDKIVTKYGSGKYAAKICFDLILNGYSDWYLPSRSELNKLYLNRFAIGNFQQSNTSFAKYYWISTDEGPISQNFNTGTFYINGPNWNASVRAIRSF